MKKLSEEENYIKYLSFSRNFGKEAAMMAGLENASGDYVAIMDVDLQDPPSKIEEMYKIIKNNPDIDCVGLKTNSHDDYGFIRRILLIFFIRLFLKCLKLRWY